MREILTTTVAIVRWTPQNLSTIYNARCDASDGCMGFDVPLPKSGQRLVVNASTLPVDLVTGTAQDAHEVTLAQALRPPSIIVYRVDNESLFLGDILMPHNIQNLSTTPWTPSVINCDDVTRVRLKTYINNHVYMESSFQPTITAAAFFLFQNGVVRDILPPSTASHTVLSFAANVQNVDVYVFIPKLNVWLTLAGCMLLAIIVGLVLVWPSMFQRGWVDPLDYIEEPHLIASVLLNENAYPPLLLSRAVVEQGEGADPLNANTVMIQSLSLQRKKQKDKTSESTTTVDP